MRGGSGSWEGQRKATSGFAVTSAGVGLRCLFALPRAKPGNADSPRQVPLLPPPIVPMLIILPPGLVRRWVSQQTLHAASARSRPWPSIRTWRSCTIPCRGGVTWQLLFDLGVRPWPSIRTWRSCTIPCKGGVTWQLLLYWRARPWPITRTWRSCTTPCGGELLIG